MSIASSLMLSRGGVFSTFISSCTVSGSIVAPPPVRLSPFAA